MSVLTLGTVAFDTIQTPYGSSGKVVGGAASYIALAVSHFTQQQHVVSVIGDDFPQPFLAELERRGASLDGLTRVPGGESFHWSALLTCYNAVGLALYSILTRKLSGIVATETMQFYMGALGTITLLPLAVWTWAAPSSLFEWFLLITLGAWGWAGHELLTRAHSFAPANTLMPYTYSFMIFLTIESYLIFADIPDRWTFMGAFIVVISGLIIWKRAQIRDQTI